MNSQLGDIPYIDQYDISGKKVLLCIDMDVALDGDGNIVDDRRVRESFPTMEYLLGKGNTLILAGKIGRPKGKRDEYHSTQRLVSIVQENFPDRKIHFVSDFLDPKQTAEIHDIDSGSIVVLENMRFWDEEVSGDEVFAQKLAALAEVYVNDAF